MLRSCSLEHPASMRPAISSLAPQAPAAITPEVVPNWNSGSDTLSQDPSSPLSPWPSTARRLRLAAGRVASSSAERCLLLLLSRCLLLFRLPSLPVLWVDPLSGGWARLLKESDPPRARGRRLKPFSSIPGRLGVADFLPPLFFLNKISPWCIGEKLTGSPDTRKDSGAGTLKPKWHRTFATFATSS